VTDQERDDPSAEIDALVTGIAPRVTAPAVPRVDAVLVTGPWLAGVSSVATALGQRFPEYTIVEAQDLRADEAPAAVVFVVSAAAVLTESDCALIDAVASDTDVVIAAVSKIDVHRQWRELMAIDRDTLAAHASRYRRTQWVGVAAAPEHGESRVDDLVAAVRTQLNEPDVARRNHLRAWESRLQAAVNRYEHDAEGAGRQARAAALREQRSTALRQRRLSKSERAIGLRSQIQQARVHLSYFARNRSASVRNELQEDVTALTRRSLPRFEPYALRRIDEVVTEVDEGCTKHLADVARVSGLTDCPQAAAAPLPRVEVPSPSLQSRRPETRLMMLLGAGFGLSVALALTRLLADLTPELSVAGVIACVTIGLALAVWVVGTRGLLHDRAVLDRWIGEATSALRGAVEQLVATRVLTAESALSSALGQQDEVDATRVADQVGGLDRELREHAVADARAAALRDREVPALQTALDQVRAELGDGKAEESADEQAMSNGSMTSAGAPGDHGELPEMEQQRVEQRG
jgi:hypothetical protein